MISAGIDIGSRTIELILIKDKNILEVKQTDSGYDPMMRTKELLKEVKYDQIMATGYGRHLFESSYNAPTVTEIKAYSVGARTLFPEARTILDIGGQDSKVISLNDCGKIRKFEMNDRCAAGTGRFLEIMAHALGFKLENFGEEALKAKKDVSISSMCTVFAESEITSLIAKGENPQEIALGLHRSVVRRAVGMLNRIKLEKQLVFAGGVARNPCIKHLLEKILNKKILVPENPQMVGALGAAILSDMSNNPK